jgi:hypothetical protein
MDLSSVLPGGRRPDEEEHREVILVLHEDMLPKK